MKNKKNHAINIGIICLSIVVIGAVGVIVFQKIVYPYIKYQKYEHLDKSISIPDVEVDSLPDEQESNQQKLSDNNKTKKKKSIYSKSVIGWIQIDNTCINYPVLYKENDNDYYLSHDYKDAYDEFGSIFLDGNSHIGSKNMVLYGHNINLNYNSMFRELTKFENKSFFDSVPEITCKLGKGADKWEVIGCAVVDMNSLSYDFTKHDFKSNKEFVDYANKALSSCIVKKDGIKINKNDQLLTLATCSYHTGQGRTVLICRRKF